MKRLLCLLKLTLLYVLFASSTPTYAAASCTWRNSSVFEGQWLECLDCTYRYCECQPNGRWGNCTDIEPDKSCDWNNPDWNNPACSEGGFQACDWSNPDPGNPSCDAAHSGGSTAPSNPKCAKCHPSQIPSVTPNPGNDPVKLYEIGEIMYGRTCATCHSPLANSTKKGRKASDILNARAFHIALEPTNNTWADGWKAKSLELVLSGNPPPSSGGSSGGNWSEEPTNWTQLPTNWMDPVTDWQERPSTGIKEGVAYEIIAYHSDKCLDLRDRGTDNGTPYQQWECSGEAHQKFYFEKNWDGTYQIRNAFADRCISVNWGYTDEGADVHSWDCEGNPDQRIYLESNDYSNTYSLKFHHSDHCARVKNSSKRDGSDVIQSECDDDDKSQAWQIVR